MRFFRFAVAITMVLSPEMLLVRAAKLRRRASHCREMAEHALSEAIAAELNRVADEFERDAVTVETCARQAADEDELAELERA